LALRRAQGERWHDIGKSSDRVHTSRVDAQEYARMDAAEGRMWWYRALHERILAALVPVTGRVLDAGCGTGGMLHVLARRRSDLGATGVEWAAEAARGAAAKSGAQVVCGSVNALPLARGSFDAAIAADVLCHARVEPRAALAELRRVLRPGATLIVNMPAYAWLMSTHDRQVHNVRRMTRAELRTLLVATGFAPVQIIYWNSLLLPLMIVRRKVVLWRHISASDVAPTSPWLDAILFAITVFERRMPFALPAGGSVFAVAHVSD
jgi:SAM-dependent methyltransferase